MYEYGMKFDQLYGFRVALCAALVLNVLRFVGARHIFRASPEYPPKPPSYRHAGGDKE
jgi:hypothetical protein